METNQVFKALPIDKKMYDTPQLIELGDVAVLTLSVLSG